VPASSQLKKSCFFFQAEDGIRDGHVTGVQTCALPISGVGARREVAARVVLQGQPAARRGGLVRVAVLELEADALLGSEVPNGVRSEERRVGKECRARWARCQ